MWGRDEDEDDLGSLDTGRWRENVIYRIAVLEERLRTLKERVEHTLPHVKANTDFKEQQKFLEEHRDTKRTEARAHRAFLIALISVALTVVSLVARYFELI